MLSCIGNYNKNIWWKCQEFTPWGYSFSNIKKINKTDFVNSLTYQCISNIVQILNSNAHKNLILFDWTKVIIEIN